MDNLQKINYHIQNSFLPLSQKQILVQILNTKNDSIKLYVPSVKWAAVYQALIYGTINPLLEKHFLEDFVDDDTDQIYYIIREK